MCRAIFFSISWPRGWGAIAFWSGLLIGDAGMFALLLRHYGRLAERGY